MRRGRGREKHWHKNLGTKQGSGVGTLCVIFTPEASRFELPRQTFDYSRWGGTTGREYKLSERFDISDRGVRSTLRCMPLKYSADPLPHNDQSVSAHDSKCSQRTSR